MIENPLTMKRIEEGLDTRIPPFHSTSKESSRKYYTDSSSNSREYTNVFIRPTVDSNCVTCFKNGTTTNLEVYGSTALPRKTISSALSKKSDDSNQTTNFKACPKAYLKSILPETTSRPAAISPLPSFPNVEPKESSKVVYRKDLDRNYFIKNRYRVATASATKNVFLSLQLNNRSIFSFCSCLVWLLFILTSTFQVVQCSDTCLKLETLAPKKYLFEKLTLATSERITHRLATAIFRIFLAEKVGYQNVTIEKYRTNWNAYNWITPLDSPYNDISTHSSDYKSGTINLEVWKPPSKDAIFQSSNDVVNCGSQGSGGRFGWFVTKGSSSIEDEDQGLVTDHWRAFMNERTAEYFALTDEEDFKLRTQFTNINGVYFCQNLLCEEGVYTPPQCKGGVPCATLFVGDYQSSSFLVKQIKVQKLLVRVMWIGPNLTPHFVEHFRPANRDMVFFSWWPNTLSTLPNILPVSFPPCTKVDHIDPSEEFACRYELHSLEKHVSKHLRKTARTLFQAVERFHLTGGNYQYLLHQYRHKMSAIYSSEPITDLRGYDDDVIIERIACDWLKNSSHADILSNWTPMYSNNKPKLWIGGIFPINGKGRFKSKELVRAAYLAEERINNDSSVLDNFEFSLKLQDGQCNRDSVLTAFINYVIKGSDDFSLNFNQMVGILGPSCSETVEPLAGVANHFFTVIISYSAEGAIFNDEVKYPYFFRTIPENLMFQHVYQNLLTSLQWKRVASLSQSGNKYSEYLTKLLETLQAQGNTLENIKFSSVDSDMAKYLQRLKEKKYRIIIGDFYDNTARRVMCEAYHQNMTARYGYVWFIPHWLSYNWWTMDDDNYQIHASPEMISGMNSTDGSYVPRCNSSHLLEALDGHLSLGYTYFAPDDTVFHENQTVGQWKELYRNRSGPNVHLPDYAGYTYDAMWTYAFALDRLFKENLTHYADLHSNETNARFVEILKETNFTGVSGQIDFSQNAKRKSVVNVYQFSSEISKMSGTRNAYRKVGYFEAEQGSALGGKLHLNTPNDIEWLNESGEVPSDGSDSCTLGFIAEALNIACQSATIIVIIFIFSVISAILVIVIFIFKRRLDTVKRSRVNWPQMKDCEVERDKIVMNRTIGKGQFGEVYGGEIETQVGTWTAAAIKKLNKGSTDEDRLDFLQEASMMKSFDHPNIIKLLGLCLSKEPILMVMEFMLHGDLKVFLLARRQLVSKCNLIDDNAEMSNRKLTRMALDVARALEYIAENKYVHRDVACRNCLVGVDMVVKLGDFGMARRIQSSEYYRFSRKGLMPVRWMAPESLDEGIFTTASDLWSYGVLLYEMITFGNVPFHGLNNNQVVEEVQKGNTIPIPPAVKSQIKQFLQKCWRKIPEERPSFSEVITHLTNNPWLLSPCLEMPSASVEEHVEGNETPHFRKMSGPLRTNNNPGTIGATNASLRQRTMPSSPVEANGTPNDPSGYLVVRVQNDRHRVEGSGNGNGPLMEPLLSTDSYVKGYNPDVITRGNENAYWSMCPLKQIGESVQMNNL